MPLENIVFPLHSAVASPTFLATADIHLGKKLYNTPELEEDLKDNFVRLVDLAISKKVDYLVVAGDLFEDNNRVKPDIIAFVIEMAKRLKQQNIKLVGIAGDHDKPIKNKSWVRISKVEPVTIEPAFAGIDYFDYSSTTTEELINLLKKDRDCSKVQWIFLHCQFPQLFKMAEAKKTIDFNRLNLFDNFPNIQGIIAGDIHSAMETKAYGVGHEAYVGYPGSLGITDKSEYKHDKHVLYCDGKNLYHLPFPQIRVMREIDFRHDVADKFDVLEHIAWAKKQTIKPIIYLYCDTDSERQLGKIVPLYEHALVKRIQVKLGSTDPVAESIMSCRSEASSEDKIEKALKISCGNNEGLYKLSSDLLKDDVKDTLDKFKATFEL